MKKKDRFKILFLFTLASGTAYYRVVNFAKYMNDKDVSVAVYPSFDPESNETVLWEHNLKDDKTRQDILGLIMISDIVVFQKIHTPLGLAFFRMVRDHSGNPILMESDDDFTAVDSKSPSYAAYNPGSDYEWWNIKQLEDAHDIITSTQYLKDRFSLYNKRIHVIPNSIDFSIWNQCKMPKHKGIRIGWIGSCTHQRDLEMVKDVLTRVVDKYKNVEFYCVGYDPKIWKDNKKIHVIPNWSNILDYPKFMAKFGFDIGIAPLRDNNFNRAKSNLRWLEYSALKIPCVASNVEPFKCIKNNEDGLLADSTADFERSLCSLIENKELRKQIGSNAYNRVKKDFNVKITAKKYTALLKELVDFKKVVDKNFKDKEEAKK